MNGPDSGDSVGDNSSLPVMLRFVCQQFVLVRNAYRHYQHLLYRQYNFDKEDLLSTEFIKSETK